MTEKRRRAAALQKLLLGGFDLCGFDFGSGVGVLFGETLDAAGGVNQLLLAGEERVAASADVDVQLVALYSRASGEIVAAGAMHRDGVIVGMNTGFHLGSILSRPVCTALRQGRRTIAASLGREAILNHTRSVKFCQTG